MSECIYSPGSDKEFDDAVALVSEGICPVCRTPCGARTPIQRDELWDRCIPPLAECGACGRLFGVARTGGEQQLFSGHVSRPVMLTARRPRGQNAVNDPPLTG